jgi:hypothetical protein
MHSYAKGILLVLAVSSSSSVAKTTKEPTIINYHPKCTKDTDCNSKMRSAAPGSTTEDYGICDLCYATASETNPFIIPFDECQGNAEECARATCEEGTCEDLQAYCAFDYDTNKGECKLRNVGSLDEYAPKCKVDSDCEKLMRGCHPVGKQWEGEDFPGGCELCYAASTANSGFPTYDECQGVTEPIETDDDFVACACAGCMFIEGDVPPCDKVEVYCGFSHDHEDVGECKLRNITSTGGLRASASLLVIS